MRRGYALLAVAVLAGVGALVWWSPWETGSAPVVTLALEAFGSRPVVHVLAREESTSRPVAAGDGIEIWYPGPRRVSHIVVRRDGKVVLDVLRRSIEPPDVTPILAVPATLWDFVTGYRSDLAAGRFRAVGSRPIEGRPVVWLRSPNVEVAVDRVSHQPLWVGDPDTLMLSEPLPIQLVTAETIPFDASDFVLLRKRKPRHL